MSRELRAMLRLAWPVVLAELGWITMGIVDTKIVGPLGPAAIGAVGTGSTMFFAVMVLGMGTLFALDTFVSQSFGAGRIDECHRWLFAGLQLGVMLSLVLVVIGLAAVSQLSHAGIHAEVSVLLQPYLSALLWSVPPLLVFTVLRRYLQAMNVVRPTLFAVISANVLNAVANWALVFGHLGFPALGVVGSAYATLAARVYMMAVLAIVVIMRERRRPSGLHDVPFALDVTRMRSLVRLGLPAAVQLMLEVGVFAAASALAAVISPAAVAAHQIVLNIASFFFMIPVGLASAGAVRVGHAVGRGDLHGARRAGWSAIGLALTAAVVMSCAFAIAPTAFLRIFTDDPGVLVTGATLLLICAVFQPFDFAQSVTTGSLRGLGETRVPMVANLAGHWFLGLPIAYWLCFTRDWGVVGIWSGLTAGIVPIGACLILVWNARSRAA